MPGTWSAKAAFKVRYVRVSTATFPAPTDDQARSAITRAFDYLPTPPTDIDSAWLATWQSGADLNTKDGVAELLGHLDDQHDCALSEWLFPWEEDCPDADGAVWAGIGNGVAWGGKALGYQLDGVSSNTAVVPLNDIDTIAHELGHTLGLNHVKVPFGFSTIGKDPDGPHDDLPNGEEIVKEDIFDPTAGKVPSFLLRVFDLMSYAVDRWISRDNWEALLKKF